MCDYDGVCIEGRQPAEVCFVRFHPNDGDAASRECGERINRSGRSIIEPAHERIAGRDAAADYVSGKTNG